MTTEIILMPDMDGAGDVTEYCIKAGDEVSIGDSLVVIESDKASMELPSAVKGVLIEWLVQIGDSVVTEQPLASFKIAAQESTTEKVSSIDDVKTIDNEKNTNSQKEPAITDNEKTQHSIVDSVQNTEIEEIVLMPDAGGKGDILEFYVKEGDVFEEGEALVLVESDKAAMDVPAAFSGKVVTLIAALGESVEEGSQLLKVLRTASVQNIEELNVSVHNELPSGGDSSSQKLAAELKPIAETSLKSQLSSPQKGQLINEINTANYAGPATRKLARELSVELSVVRGSGPRGRVLKEDVKEFVSLQMAKGDTSNGIEAASLKGEGAGIPPMPIEDFSRFGGIETQSLSGIAKATSAHMTRCWLNIPHVTLFDDVDITDLENYRAEIKLELFDLVKKPTILPFIIMVIAKTLRKYPKFNSSLASNGEQIIYKDYVNIGVAVDTPAGLVVPVIKDADKKSIRELAEEINALAAKAKARKLEVKDMQGGCFTVSSLGAMGGTGFTPIINAPEVAILGVGKAQVKPVWLGNEFQPRKKLPLNLSFDHRVINGADAGYFMAQINQYLSKVTNLLL